MAAPQGGTVTSGAATIGQAGSVTHIDQSTQRATINWQGFGIGVGETVNFNQPNASAITLNRVIGNERSVIDGVLNANGKVFLINSNGVLFTRGSSVNTSGLVASTLNISDADFNAGRYVFNGNGGSGAVINMGTLTAANGGYVALLGNSVSNQGVIVATKGTVALASGEKISLNFNGDSLVSVSIDEGTLGALVENKGVIYADGGKVILTAKAADDLLGSQVNNTGIVQARTVDDLKGSIVVRADGGTANVGGTLDASAPVSGGGGTIETSGRSARVSDDATITTKAANGSTGTWTLASDGFTVDAGANISGAQLGTQLGNNNVVIASGSGSGGDGHLRVNQAVSWSADTALTLTAANDIFINAPITATGLSAGLNLNFGSKRDYSINTAQGASVTLSGANATLAMNGQSYTLIHSMSDLEAIDDAGGVAAGRYALAGNLDASGKTYGNTVVSALSGTLAGLGHTISNLTILEPVHNDLVETATALVGTAQVGSVIRDIGMVNVNVSGYGRVGGLVGENFGGSISHAYVTGTVQGAINVGGLVGYNGSGSDPVSGAFYVGDGIISDSYSNAAVTGSSRYDMGAFTNIGGLVGRNNGARYKILRSSATGNVSVFAAPNSNVGSQNIGGLVGSNAHGTIADSHATGNVTVSDKIVWVGGLVGVSGGSPSALITNSYATGDVTGGQSAIGGLVGYNGDGGARIIDSYATGNVKSINGTQDFGGLVGVNSGSTISGSHASGTVTVTGISAGGLVGNNGGSGASITNSYATGDVNGGPISSGVGGLVGANSGTISGSHSSGDVSGSISGGLVGGNQGTITDSYSTGNVFGSYAAGGLVGQMDGGTISNSRSSGNVTGSTDFDFTGGLVGRMQGGDIDNSHATGTVTGGSGTAELVGNNTGTGTITNSTYRDAAAEAAAQAAAEAAARAAAAAQAAAQAAAEAAAQASGQAAVQAAAQAQAAAVAAAQAAARAATLQARADTGSRLAAAAAADAQRQPERPAAQLTAGLTQRAALLADNIVFADKRNFSANVQRIEIDGKVFELEDEDGKAPAAQPPTPR